LDCFCDFYTLLIRGVQMSLYFMKGVPASKKVGNLCPRESSKRIFA